MTDTGDSAPGRPVLTIGNFDGIHLGHQEILGRCVHRAHEYGTSSLVLTFDRHPKSVLHPHGGPRSILTLSERIEMIRRLGVDRVDLLITSPELLSQSPEAFIRDVIVGQYGARRIVEGPDFRFGKDSEGDLQFLEEMGKQYGFEVEVASPVFVHGRMVSSTMIRSLLKLGEVSEVADALGRPFSVRGNVIPGKRLGQKIGFPTLNILPPSKLLPRHGVYLVSVSISGSLYPGAAYWGHAHASPKGQMVLEAHLFDWQGDLYQRKVEIFFLHWIREVMKFDSEEALKTQIDEDCRAAKAFFESAVKHA